MWAFVSKFNGLRNLRTLQEPEMGNEDKSNTNVITE